MSSLKKQKYGEGPDFSRKYTTAVRAVVGRVSDGVRTTVRTDKRIMNIFARMNNGSKLLTPLFIALASDLKTSTNRLWG